MKRRKIISFLAASALVSANILQAYAHTDALGWLLTGGSVADTYDVEIFYGSWHARLNSTSQEGSLVLNGPGSYSETVPFSMVAGFENVANGTRPADLVEGTNFWYPDTSTTAQDDFKETPNGSIYSFQSAAFTGLAEGTYTFGYAAGALSQNWTPSDGAINAGSFTIGSGGSVVLDGAGPAIPDIDTNKSDYTPEEVQNGQVNPVFDGGTLSIGSSGTVSTNFTVTNNAGTISPGSNNVTFSGTITNATGANGGLNKSGSGTLTLAGDTTLTGDFNVNEGTLNLQEGGTINANVNTTSGTFIANGNVNGDVTVSGDGSTFKGAGTVGNVTLNNGSIHAPGNSPGTQNVGNYNLGAGATLQIEVTDAGVSDKLVVTGTVTLAGNLQVKRYAGDFNGTVYTYTIIDNDGVDAVNGAFASVSDDMAFVDTSVSYVAGTGNDVVLTLTRNRVALQSVAQSGNQNAVGTALNDLPVTTGSAAETQYNAIIAMSAANARSAFDALSGEIYATTPGILADRFESKLVGAASAPTQQDLTVCGVSARPENADAELLKRLEDARLDCIMANTFKLVATGDYRYSTSDGNSHASGFASGGMELSMLAPLPNSDNFMGGSIAYERGHIEVQDVKSTANTTSYSAMGFAGWQKNDWQVIGAAGVQKSDANIQRSIVYPGASYNAAANMSSYVYGGVIGTSYTHEDERGLVWRTHASLSHTFTNGGAFSETGTNNLLLNGVNSTFASTRITLGLDVFTEADWNGVNFRPNLGVALAHELDDVAGKSIQNFQGGGGNFTVEGGAKGRTSIQLGTGFALDWQGGSSLVGSYTAQISAHHLAHQAKLGIQGRF